MKTLTIQRPWGRFDQFTQNELTTVKIITINPNSSLSLQHHLNRNEFWRVLSGHPQITIGENTITANPGDEFMVEKSQNHRIAATDETVEILEIAYGEFDENDITRIDDIYGRA